MLDGLHERLHEAAEHRTFRSISELTSTNAETVRRYMHGQTPSLEFVVRLCTSLEVSLDWMLRGEGPMRAEEVRLHALRDASPAELVRALGTRVESIEDRLDRLGVFAQHLERLARAGGGTGPTGEGEGDAARGARASAIEGKDPGDPTPPTTASRPVASDEPTDADANAERIADAVARGSRASPD